MDGCPPLEDIAAFLDGKLSPEERARMTEHLARCESCYEIFAGAVHFQEDEAGSSAEDTGGRGVLPFPLRGKEDRPPRRISRWFPLAASVVLAAGLGFIAWQLFTPPTITLAGVVEPVEKKPEISASLYESEVERGIPKESDSLFGPEFMVGVHLLDLRLSVQGGKVDATARRLQDLGTELQAAPLLGELGQQFHREYAQMGTAEDLDRFAAELPDREKEIESFLSDSPSFQFGLWTETGRLAAVTQTREFFKTRKNRRFLSHLQKTLPKQLGAELREPVLDDLQAIKHIWNEGELSPQGYRTLATHFQNIIRRIDDYEDHLPGDV